MSARNLARIFLLSAAALWGFSSPVAKYALGYLPASLVLTYRFFLVCIILLPAFRILKLKTPKLSCTEIFYLFILGLLGTVGQIGLIYLGFTYTTAVDGTLIIAASPIIVAVTGVIFLKERVTAREKLGMAIATLGSVVVVLSPLINSGNFFSGSLKGNFFILLANFCWAAYVLISKKFAVKKLHPMFLTTWMFVIGFFGMLAISLFNYTPQMMLGLLLTTPLSGHISVIYLAVGAGILGYLFYQKGLKQIEASEAELFSYLIPVFATPLSAVWLGEPITITFILSALLIAVGVLTAETDPTLNRPKKRK